ncbi:hypothetical protein BN59_03639 [Legionella massiliensis]|uniref:Uncharacterized protein n=1 Tax=Legionella massiliensis TaxID=1034943 RepID=A0A078L298_9GAMM|nr:hypothetical protein BN59_03639 [Legionella massiliensis]CEE15059.1 hypothetical protein BN1094_03639 [Legionella massiliensis]
METPIMRKPVNLHLSWFCHDEPEITLEGLNHVNQN